ncbi:MAG: type II toxin-antitoxin system RelE/ParE family toxin [Methylobacillus sp.]|jgi:mRNA-degrading endonuclease RelE of RelBE toxin-antitoxin system|nr:type II toxin-antitoxin system RelE/ParE family toxin [Methylobacillus sp.]
MTVTGAGGVKIATWRKGRRFHRDYDKLDIGTRDLTDEALQQLTKEPRPPGLRFEKLKGHSNPDIYTIHVTGNYKVSMEIDSSCAFLRRVANHDEIDRQP